MARPAPERSTELSKKMVLSTASRLFLEKGYTATTLREIAKESGVNIGSLMYLFESKENILCELVTFVLDGQFHATEALIQGLTDDKVLFWAAETTLQLYMAECNEEVRELYIAAYSMRKSSEIIYQTIAGKMAHYFGEYHPNYETKDFYELEIASGGIIRGFMSVPCDMYFTMERKVKRYLETSFLVYGIPREKILEAIDFVSHFDFKSIAGQVVDSMLAKLNQAVISSEALMEGEHGTSD